MALFQALVHDYGNRVRFPMGLWTFYLLNDPESAGFVLSHHAHGFRKGPGLTNDNPLIGRGLLTVEGAEWADARRRLSPVFRPRNVMAMRPGLEEALRRMLDLWAQDPPEDIEAAMMDLSLFLVLHNVFGASDLSLAAIRRLTEDVDWLMRFFYHRSRTIWRFPYAFPFNRRYHRHAHRLIATVRAMTTESRPYVTVHGHLAADSLTRQHELLTLTIAGYETTGHAMAWALFLTATHPAVEAALLREARQQVFPTPQTHPWTYAVILESLRLYPPVWLLSRTPTRTVPFDEGTFRPGDILLISPWLMHRNAHVFPEPDAFRPERWLGSGPPPPYAFLPFGGGPRRCIGEDLALTEAVLVVSRVLAQFHLTALTPPNPPVFGGLTLRSRDGLRMRLQPRTE
ncbi:MAG: cytochrome P450 [Firmicutes bacterium]|nr:cytochrome P450 [Bacillota bacterium]